MAHTHPFWLVLLFSYLRYFAYAGVAFLVFYIWRRKAWSTRKIQPRFPEKGAIRREVLYSLSTALIFGTVIYSVLFSRLRRHTLIYRDLHAHTLWYFGLSVLAAIVLHDTYFYWTHRLMHHRRIFPYVHKVHHRSHNPTPWAAYAFHPLEALVEVGIVPLMVVILPLHPLALSAFGLYMIAMNVMGHLGYELYPRAFMQNRVLRVVFNTSTHHNMHHRYNKGNYGLYFNLWDRLMKTNHSTYETTFLSITQKTNVHEKDQPPHYGHAGHIPDGLGGV